MSNIVFEYYDGKDIYNDGDIESELIDYYRNNTPIDFDRDDIFFHTTCIRQNIVNWYPFKSNSRILEIGAGTGAVTGALLDTGNDVVAVEGSKRRAEVIAARHNGREKLTIYCGNFNIMNFEEKFDYIVLIGVFEYSRIFCDGVDPFGKFLENIKKQLKPDGKILIAIENKLGLKYFNGLSEDHYGKPYVGLEDYQDNTKAETFGRDELRRFFENNGLKSKFYGVFPDYKLPSYIFSENYFPDVNDARRITQYNYADDLPNFAIDKVARSILKNNSLIDFSNSFLVELSNDGDFAEVDYVTYQNYRNDKYLIGTSVGKEIVKFPVGDGSEKHLDDLLRVHTLLNEANIPACKIVKKRKRYLNEKIVGKTVLEVIRDLARQGKKDLIIDELDSVNKYIHSIAKAAEAGEDTPREIIDCYGTNFEALPVALFDLQVANIIKSKKGYVLIDQEWVDKCMIPVRFYFVKLLWMLFDQVPEISDLFSIGELANCFDIKIFELDVLHDIDHWFFDIKMEWLDIERKERLINKNIGKSIKLHDIESENYRLKNKGFVDYQLLEYYKYELNKIKKDFNSYVWQSEIEKSQLKDKVGLYGGVIIVIAKSVQNFFAKVFPTGGFVRKTGGKILKLIKFLLRNIKRGVLAIIYNIFPKRFARKIFYLIHFSEGKARLLHEIYFGDTQRKIYVENNSERVLNNALVPGKTVAVHLHLYYVDLIDEFYKYLSHIPYRFDLYVSVVDSRSIRRIRRKFRKLLFVDKIFIKETENSGRDFGPMFVLFGDKLRQYDYLLHIHSKKSLRTGLEQSEWRHYLLDGLLGSCEMVMQYFDLMDNSGVGMIYPDTSNKMPLWCHNWLQAFGVAREYFGKFGLEVNDEYLDFSVGSMFWCKTDAIRQLFELNLTWDDFGVENGASDGTLAHALERCMGSVVRMNDYNYAVLNSVDGKIYANRSLKNVNEYVERNMNVTEHILQEFDTITFDIFDTLVTRTVYSPEDVFLFTDKKVQLKYGLESGKYIRLRKEAEEELRRERNYVGDVTIHEIYGRFAQKAKIPSNMAEDIKQIEIETDINTMLPRRDMLNIYNKLLIDGKKIIIISDMYYTKEIIEDILHRCGYNNYHDLLVSSETNCRKSNGTMWQYYWTKYPTLRSIHVGDNETSDIHYPIIHGKPTLHILQGKKMFELSDMNIKRYGGLDNMVAQGLVLNKYLVNSPFVLNNNLKIKITSLKEYGYVALGPLLFYFMRWLIRNTESGTTLLFVSREGYFLQRIFHDVLRHTKYSCNFDDRYFLISRRAVSVPNIKNEDDIRVIAEVNYSGTFVEFVYTRFGLLLTDCKNFDVVLPRDIEKVMGALRPKFSEIYNKAKQERNNYLKYIKKDGGLNNDKICVVDLGYSGTAQFYLSKMLNKRVDGAYMIVTNNLKPLSINGNEVMSCVNGGIYADDFLAHGVGRHTMPLEAFLTSDVGQLQCFDDNGEPIFANTGDNRINELKKVYEGVKEFIDDISKYCEKDILDIDLEQEFVESNYEKIISGADFADEIKGLFKVEDLYNSNKNIDVS